MGSCFHIFLYLLLLDWNQKNVIMTEVTRAKLWTDVGLHRTHRAAGNFTGFACKSSSFWKQWWWCSPFSFNIRAWDGRPAMIAFPLFMFFFFSAILWESERLAVLLACRAFLNADLTKSSHSNSVSLDWELFWIIKSFVLSSVHKSKMQRLLSCCWSWYIFATANWLFSQIIYVLSYQIYLFIYWLWWRWRAFCDDMLLYLSFSVVDDICRGNKILSFFLMLFFCILKGLTLCVIRFTLINVSMSCAFRLQVVLIISSQEWVNVSEFRKKSMTETEHNTKKQHGDRSFL